MATKRDERLLYAKDVQKDEQGRSLVSMSEQEVLDWRLCANDILHFADNHCYIFTVDGGTSKIKLYDWQKQFLKERTAMNEHGNPVWNNYILMCGRRSGKTTSSAIYILHKILFHPLKKEIRALIMSLTEDHAQDIMTMIKDLWLALPKYLQRPIKRWLKATIELDNGSWIKLAGCTQYKKARGSGLNLLYIDESAFIPSTIYDKFVSAVFPTVTTGKSYTITMTSTPLAFNHFYKTWTKAENNENGYGYMRVNWDQIPMDYEDDGTPIYRDQEWADDILKTICGNDMLKFKEEFECEFLVNGGSGVFDIPDDIFKNAKELNNSSKSSYKFYEHYDPNFHYAIGVDIGEGVSQDYSVIKVFKMLPINIEENLYKYEEVASFRNNEINTYNFASIIEEFDELYPNNRILVENNNHGHVVLQALQLREVLDLDKLISESKNRLGLMSTSKSKGLGFSTIKKLLKNKQLTIKDTTLYSELISYKGVNHKFKEVKTDKELEKLQKRDGYKNQSSEHDDTVMATMWALYIENAIGAMDEICQFYREVFEGEVLTPEERLKRVEHFFLDQGRGIQTAKHSGLSHENKYNMFDGMTVEAYDAFGNQLIDLESMEDFDDIEDSLYYQQQEEAEDNIVRDIDIFARSKMLTNQGEKVIEMYVP